jgi:hypothetical protein
MGACFFGLRQDTARTETVGALDRGSRYDILDEYSVDEMIRIDNEAREEQELERMDVIFSGDFLDHSIRSDPIPIR